MNHYDQPDRSSPLTQGDILAACPVFTMSTPPGEPDGPIEGRLFTLQVVVLTQACDLEQAKTTRVVIAPIFSAQAFVAAGYLKAAQVRDQVRTGRMFGLYYLPAFEPAAFPESIVDFRDLHAVPRRQLDGLVASGNRVARLVTPFREHLAQHFAVTYMRIALPEPFPTRP